MLRKTSLREQAEIRSEVCYQIPWLQRNLRGPPHHNLKTKKGVPAVHSDLASLFAIPSSPSLKPTPTSGALVAT